MAVVLARLARVGGVLPGLWRARRCAWDDTATLSRLPMTPTQQALHGAIQAGIAELQGPIRQVGAQLAVLSVHGVPAIRAHYDRVWSTFASRRRRILRAVLEVATRQRALDVGRAATAHLGHVLKVAPAVQSRAVEQALSAPIGPRAWHFNDLIWPRDQWIKRRFFAALSDATIRRDRMRRREEQGTLPKIEAAARPKIDPQHKKIDYPINSAMTDAELIQRAADTVVVARGEYYAATGIHDATRAADQAFVRIVSGEIRQIGAWQWTLSPAHDPSKCPGLICDTLAQEDVGYGPGVYLDVLLPESHVCCMCVWEAVWLEPGEAEPVADDDYEDRVRGLMDSLGVVMLGMAAGSERAACCG